MKIKVISLSSSTARRFSIERQLRNVGAPFEFADAITADEALRHVHHYDEKEFRLNCGRSATATEIACYASHLALWRQCAGGQHPYLILEDDAALDASFIDGLMVVASEIAKRGLVRVSVPDVGDSPSTADSRPFRIHYCRRVPLLALGYAISPQAAGRLAAAGRIVEEPVDKYMQRFWRHGQPVYAMCPPIVRHAAVAAKSDIGERNRPPYGPVTWARRSARKAQNAIARLRFNVAYSVRIAPVD